jgi:hypothetical protein
MGEHGLACSGQLLKQQAAAGAQTISTKIGCHNLIGLLLYLDL